MKKIFIGLSIICIFAVAFIFTLNIFDVIELSGVILKILYIMATIGVASILAINSTEIYQLNKLLSIISLSLITVSACLTIIQILSQAEGFMTKYTVTFASASVIFCIIISNYIKLGKNYQLLQIITYIFITALALIILCNVWGVSIDKNLYEKLLLLLILFSIIFLIILSVVQKKKRSSIGTETNASFEKNAYISERELNEKYVLKEKYDELYNKYISLKEKYENLKK